MSDDLKSDILKAVTNGNKANNDTSKITGNDIVFKEPQVLVHCLIHPFHREVETRDTNENKHRDK